MARAVVGAALAASSACSVAGTSEQEASAVAPAPVRLRPGMTVRVSVGLDGRDANYASREVKVSGDGRLVVFSSWASNLVADDRNDVRDVFVRDLQTGETTRVSVGRGGSEGDQSSCCPHISANGRYVSFASLATDLVPGDTNGVIDVFVHDRRTGDVDRVSVSSAGAEANAGSRGTYMSGDGRFVTFNSRASNLVPDEDNGVMDGFVHDRRTGTTERVVLNGHTSSLSADGRYVAFRSFASSLVRGDTNAIGDAFVLDRETGRVQRVNVSSRGEQANARTLRPTLTPDGRYVVFRSYASNLVPRDTNMAIDVFLHDRVRGVTERISVDSAEHQVPGGKGRPFPSNDGRFVVFRSLASGFVPGDTNGAPDIFIRDRVRGTTTRVSVSSTGRQANGASGRPAINGNGRVVAFPSLASDLVRGDRNGRYDIFAHALRGGR